MAFACKAIVFVAALATASHAQGWEPMVAFVCNRGSMYYTKSGWVSDRTTDCLDNPKDVLAYCQKLFPDEDVTNIVEASSEMEIAGWCPTTSARCSSKEVFSVRPFRCLRGAFQSDALVVPKQCKFDYVRESDKCQTYDWWGDVARRACAKLHGMSIQSYAMLLPCDTDMFNGVEFVCCPEAAKDGWSSTGGSSKPVIMVKASKSSAPSSASSLKSSSRWLPKGGSDAPKAKPVPAAVAASGDSNAAAVLDKYMHMAVDKGNVNEHEAFSLTKQVVEANTETRLQNIMKEWATAKNRVLELQTVDTKEAEKLNKEVTLRFQKEYFALQNEGEATLRQVESVHQQHVYSILNEKKRVAVEALIRKIDDGVEPAAVMKYLQRYVTLEQKDAEQCLRHYLNERDRESAGSAAADLKRDTIDHLRLISTRIRQAIDLVGGYPDTKAADEIQASINSWLKKGFLDIDNVVKQMSDEPATPPPPGSAAKPLTAKSASAAAKPAIASKVQPAGGAGAQVAAGEDRKSPAAKEQSVETDSSRPSEWDSYEWYDKPDSENQADVRKNDASSEGIEEGQQGGKYADDVSKPVQLTAQQIQVAYADELKQQKVELKQQKGELKQQKEGAKGKPVEAEYDDGDDSKEDEHAYFFKDVKAVKGQAAHALKANKAVDEQEFASEMSPKTSLKAGTAVAITGGVLVALAIIVGAVIVVRRKHDIKTSRRASYIEVTMDMSPEELHVMQMQMNGYENPTYRFLEMQQQAVPQQQPKA